MSLSITQSKEYYNQNQSQKYDFRYNTGLNANDAIYMRGC